MGKSKVEETQETPTHGYNLRNRADLKAKRDAKEEAMAVPPVPAKTRKKQVNEETKNVTHDHAPSPTRNATKERPIRHPKRVIPPPAAQRRSSDERVYAAPQGKDCIDDHGGA